MANASLETGRNAAALSVRKLVGLHGAAYRLAMRIAGSSQSAEDIVQQAYVAALQKLRSDSPPHEERAWFLRVVANLAKLHMRQEGRRRTKETSVKPDDSEPVRPGADLAIALGGALAALDERYRLAVSLCYEEGLSQREAAAVLEMPERTVSEHVKVGLGKLRKALERAGYPAAVTAVLGGLKQTAPAVPASLAGRVEALVAKGATKTATGTAAASVSAAAKGGIAMKVIAGLVLAGAIAAGVAVVVPGKGGAPLPAEKPRKFPTPVTHPEARWKRVGAWAGLGFMGYLDGPRRTGRAYTIPSRGLWYESGGDYVWRAYNPATDRYYTIGGRARGYLDGPLSRVRLGGRGYMSSPSITRSPDGRYLYFTEPSTHGVLRVIDFKTQTVKTILKKVNGKMTGDSKGRLWTVGRGSGSITIYNPDGSVAETKKIGWEGAGNTGQLTMSWCNILLDEKNNRLYGANRATGDWTIWYWDLATGKFHGVLPNPKKGEPKRTTNETGSFKGTAQRCPGGIAWGPDDPEHRYLYQGGGDNTTFYRLDLEKKEFVHFGPVDRNKRPFIDMAFNHGKWLPFGSVSKWCGTPAWDEEGNIHLGVSLSSTINRYKRVK